MVHNPGGGLASWVRGSSKLYMTFWVMGIPTATFTTGMLEIQGIWHPQCFSGRPNPQKSKLVGGWTTHRKNIGQIGSSPQIRVKIKSLWNHQLDKISRLFVFPTFSTSFRIRWIPSWQKQLGLRLKMKPKGIAAWWKMTKKKYLHPSLGKHFRRTCKKGATFLDITSLNQLICFTWTLDLYNSQPKGGRFETHHLFTKVINAL